MKSLTGTIFKSLVFVVVTVVATAALSATIRNSGTSDGVEYQAMFTDVTSLNRGDDIRMAGVKIGRVDDINIADQRVAKVTFSVDREIELNSGTTATIRFRNLVGQRYISLAQGDTALAVLKAGHTFDTDQTEPSLDLTMLFNGFQPLFRLLSPDDVNNLSFQIIQVFQGEGSTVEQLLSSTASLTSTVAAKDKVIGELIDNLNGVLVSVNDRSDQLSTTLITLQRLVSGLAEDREVIGSTLDGLGDLSVSVADLLEEGRPPLKASITSLDSLAGNLAAAEPVIESFLQLLPTKLDRIGRLGSYGSWLNFYVCSIEGRIPLPQGYMGDLGAQPIAGRCH